MKSPSTMDRYDFISAIVLIAFAGAVLFESLRMDRLGQLNINPYTVPGLVPGLLGAILLACGFALLIRSAARGGWRTGIGPATAGAALASPTVRRVGLVLLLCYGFAIFLFGWLPFGLAAAAFIFAFIMLLGPSEYPSTGARMRAVLIALAIALIAGYGIDLVFRQIFFVKLP